MPTNIFSSENYLFAIINNTLVIETPKLQNFTHQIPIQATNLQFDFPLLKLSNSTTTILYKLDQNGANIIELDTLTTTFHTKIIDQKLIELTDKNLLNIVQFQDNLILQFPDYFTINGVKTLAKIDFIVADFQIYREKDELICLKLSKQYRKLDYKEEKICVCGSGIALIGEGYVVIWYFCSNKSLKISVKSQYEDVVFTEFKVVGVSKEGILQEIIYFDAEQEEFEEEDKVILEKNMNKFLQGGV